MNRFEKVLANIKYDENEKIWSFIKRNKLNYWETEAILVKNLLGGVKLPKQAFAYGLYFPHHKINANSYRDHKSVDINMLKFQLIHLPSLNIPAGIKLVAFAHLLGHLHNLLPDIELSKIYAEIKKSHGMPIDGFSVPIEGITEDADGHVHAYYASINDEGGVDGRTMFSSDDTEHYHSFSGKLTVSGKISTTGTSMGDDHAHMIDFAKKVNTLMKRREMMVKMLEDTHEQY